MAGRFCEIELFNRKLPYFISFNKMILFSHQTNFAHSGIFKNNSISFFPHHRDILSSSLILFL